MRLATELRAVRIGDSGAISDAHRLCFPSGPWTAIAIERLLGDPGTFGFVSEVGASGQGLRGFCLARTVLDECEILTIGVVPDHRRQRLGSILLAATLQETQARGCIMVFLEVAEANAAAIALYHASGFDAVGRRIGYYRASAGQVQDALLLKLDSQKS